MTLYFIFGFIFTDHSACVVAIPIRGKDLGKEGEEKKSLSK